MILVAMKLNTAALLLPLLIVTTTSLLTMPDYTDHPCLRPCLDDTPARTCVYNFTVEWYHTLSKACYDCPFNITDCDRPHCIPADGFPRTVATVNRMLPGPAIQVCHKDMIVVNVYNRFETSEPTGIHWHGIHQKGYQYMDGVPFLTQCPINHHAIFTYKFSAEPAGTHYWHSHTSLQRSDGVFGALIVRQPPVTEPHYSSHLYQEDQPEHVLVVNEWMHELTLDKFIVHHHAGGNIAARGLLINGHGAKIAVPNRNNASETTYTPQTMITVEKGKRYRFRVVSNGVLSCPIQISIQNHSLLLIASDGQPIKPVVTESFNIFSGERFDFVLDANKSADNYLLRAVGLGDCDEHHYAAAQTAILHYANAEDVMAPEPLDYADLKQDGRVVNPFTTPVSDEAIPISELRSLPKSVRDPALKQKPDYKFFFGLHFKEIDNIHYHHPDFYPLRALDNAMHYDTPQINNISNWMPPSPALYQLRDIKRKDICSQALLNGDTSSCPNGFCSCLHRYHIKLGSVVEMVIFDELQEGGHEGGAHAIHPMHLHGYSFHVVGSGNVSMNMEIAKRMDREGKLPRNLVNPPRKDTIFVTDEGYIILRFTADNPGEWFFHCHLLFHSEVGMGLVFGVGQPSDLPPVPEHFPRCGSFTSDDHYEEESSACRI